MKIKIKRFKDFAYDVEKYKWSMEDIFTMLDYLAEEIEKLRKLCGKVSATSANRVPKEYLNHAAKIRKYFE